MTRAIGLLFGTVGLLILLNIVVWVLELLKPYYEPNARVRRSGLLLLLYLPLWTIVSMILQFFASMLSHRPAYFHSGHSVVSAILPSLFLALFFALLHRPLLSLLGRFILRNRQEMWGFASAVFGLVAGIALFLIVRAGGPVGLMAFVVFCVTGCLVGYSVGYVRSIKSNMS